MCRVFYVDDQEDIVWSTTKLLARKCPKMVVEGFTDPEAALSALEQHPPDIMVTDLRMSQMSGLELLVAARKIVPDLPVILVTAYGGPEVMAALQGRSLVDYLEKPVRTDTLVASIDRLLVRSEGFSGAISLPMLPDLIQVYTLTRTTGALSIRRGGSSGTMWFDNGAIVHALCGERRGETAVYEMLSWQSGEFSLDTQAQAPERTITASWQEVLLEGCRLLDEAGRDAAAVDGGGSEWEVQPPTQVVVPESLQRDAAAPSAGAAPVPVRIEDAPPGISQVPPGRPISHQEQLSQLSTIDGFVGAAVYDGSVVLHYAPEGEAFDLESAVMDSAEVLDAIHGTLDDMQVDDSVDDVVFTLGRQYHLIRPVAGKPGVFIFLILDRGHGDLTMARKELLKMEQHLDV